MVSPSRLQASLCFITLALALPACAQNVNAFTYEVVSVKPDKSASGMVSINNSNDRYTAANVSLKSLLVDAFGLKTDDQILNLPAWAGSANFDIEAKIDAETVVALKSLSRPEKIQAHKAMMRTMLIDRFQLRFHHATRELPLYTLLVAKGGPKLTPAAAATDNTGISISNQDMKATSITMEDFADNLAFQVSRQVVDKTGLTGKYDLTLRWSRDDAPTDAATPSAPSIFTAVQEQLGLRLEPTKGPVDTIVIDHIEPPSEN